MATDSGNQEQRKRALDAVERRFALVHDQQQQKEKKRPFEDKPKSISSSVNPILTTNASASLSQYSSSKKDLETDDPTYFLLSHPVHENLVSSSVKLSNKKGSVADKILHELLQKGDAAQKYMQGSKSKKFDNWILLDNLEQRNSSYSITRINALNNNSKRSKKHMSMKQHKKYGSLTLHHDLHSFEMYKPMHEMWQGYIRQLLKSVGKNQLVQCLLAADLHGAMMLVVQCKITSFTGASGFMVRETAETFAIITEDNKLRVVPKKASVFMLQADCWKLTLFGDKLSCRNMGP